MKIKRKLIITVITTFILLSGIRLQAQQLFNLNSGAEITVEGSSSLHDWEMTSSRASGEARIKLNNQQVESIDKLSVSIPVRSLKSGKGQLDKNAYEALEAGKHPTIHFTLKEVRQITGEAIIASGTLTIAGTTKPVKLEAKYRVSGTSVKLEGDTMIRFTEFELDPPSAMFGAVKAGDEVQVTFQTAFSPTVN